MPMREVDPLEDAIASTDKEIFSEAANDEPVGDQELEGMDDPAGFAPDDRLARPAGDKDGEDELADPGDDDAGDDQHRDELGRYAREPAQRTDQRQQRQPGDRQQTQAERDPGDRQNRRVPLNELTSERSRRQSAEALVAQAIAERDASRAQYDAIQARLDAIERGVRQPQQQRQPEQVPDLYTDPQGFVNHITSRFGNELAQRDNVLAHMRIENSLQIARAVNGDDFDSAYRSAQEMGRQDPQTLQRIIQSPDPGRALMDWHRRESTLREVGPDPIAYRERLTQEILSDPRVRQQILADLRQQAAGRGSAPGQRSSTTIRLPPSLSSAGGRSASPQLDADLYNNSDESVFEHAFR